jgi:hypothetical protein
LHYIEPYTIPTIHLIREIKNLYIISLEIPQSGCPVDTSLPNEYLWGIIKGEDDNPHLSIYVSFLDQADVCQ